MRLVMPLDAVLGRRGSALSRSARKAHRVSPRTAALLSAAFQIALVATPLPARADPAALPDASRVRAIARVASSAWRDDAPVAERVARQVVAQELAKWDELFVQSAADIEPARTGAADHLLRAQRQRLHDLIEQLIDAGKIRQARAGEFRALVRAVDDLAREAREVVAGSTPPASTARLHALRKRASPQVYSDPTFRSGFFALPPADGVPARPVTEAAP